MSAVLAAIGHNRPPSAIDGCAIALGDIGAFLDAHPVIQAEGVAREALALIKRGKLALDDMKDERDGRLTPILEQVEDIRAEYRQPEAVLAKVRGTLLARKDAFAEAEEARRRQEADAARQRAEAAAQAVREAETREREAHDEAASGVVGADIAGATTDADQAFRGFGRVRREAARAERSVSTRLGFRQAETLIVTDPAAAITAIGLTDKVREALLSSARDYRRLRGMLPAGVISDKLT